jgi:hypothetical protein
VKEERKIMEFAFDVGKLLSINKKEDVQVVVIQKQKLEKVNLD